MKVEKIVIDTMKEINDAGEALDTLLAFFDNGLIGLFTILSMSKTIQPADLQLLRQKLIDRIDTEYTVTLEKICE